MTVAKMVEGAASIEVPLTAAVLPEVCVALRWYRH